MPSSEDPFADSKNPDYINPLRDAIRRSHECASTHVDSVHVELNYKGKPAWDGIVEVFDLHKHPEAKQAFAWGYINGDRMKYISILGIYPVKDAWDAVYAAIISGVEGP